jgi:hypothetical protein
MASWLDPLKPAFGEASFFFEQEYDQQQAVTTGL